jgi:DNA repair exonuclease SbcCD ATPase subunit
MKIDIEGVQSIIKSTFEFSDSGLSLIYGDNSVGKSSIIRAIAAAISYDATNRDRRIIEEQKLLGILQDSSKSNLGLIRVGVDEAHINISGNLINEHVLISRSGKFKGSNPSFVITNVLSDVSWIMRILTHTTSEKISDYLKGFNDLIVRYEDVIDRLVDTKKELFQKIQDLNRMLRESSEAQKQVRKKRKTLEETKQQLKALQEKISEEAKRDPNKEERISEINSQIAEKEKLINSSARKIDELEKELRNCNATIAQLSDDIKQREKTRQEYLETLKGYDKTDIESIAGIEEEIEILKEKRSKEQVLYDILKRTHTMLEKEHSGEVVCPLCGSNKINPQEIERITVEKDEVIREFDSRISVLSRKVGDLREISKRKQDLSQNISGLDIILLRSKDDLKQLRQDAESSSSLIKAEETKRSDYMRQRDDLQVAISGDNKDEKEKLKSLQSQIRNLESVIRDLELDQKYSQINIFGTNYPVDAKTLDIFDKGVMSSLSDVESHFLELIETEKTKLKDEFNKSIKGILKEMSFDLDIYVDNNFNILARKKTDHGYRTLETQNLSRSEQATIALTLQLALADGYSPETPIILCDGIYEYFDEERRKKILSYADEFAKKHNRSIIMTVVKEGLSQPTVGIL